MNWVHCNNCVSINISKSDFYLSDCGHLFCKSCLNIAQQTNDGIICFVCGQPTICMKVGSNMEQSLKNYFMPFQTNAAIITRTSDVFQFQDSQFDMLLEKMSKYYEDLKKEYVKNRQCYGSLMKQNHLLKGKVVDLQSQNKPNPISSTPMFDTSLNYTFGNCSTIHNNAPQFFQSEPKNEARPTYHQNYGSSSALNKLRSQMHPQPRILAEIHNIGSANRRNKLPLNTATSLEELYRNRRK